ncbi:hypothetical protein JM83_1430 [Gillisia sp. Hel_I_86]|uniref:hypothetical protein n=1 Tax=Gillisia sp. Hel_I_86 TaxID=1249981 RepID=UPI0011993493|nr:hypothetical protein [Gillisia sp. Hel_I_86]TVZ26471.1 hypothetical protein JM83_1430 [Gillisia sp. Hel_I_86]
MKKKVIDLFGNKAAQDKEVKYSKLLEQFIAPFSNDFTDTEYLEDIFEFAINAWNFGNMKALMPKEEFQKTTHLMDQAQDVNAVLLKKMIDYKILKFKQHPNFIVDFELTQTNADPILTVVTKLEEDYLSEMMDIMDDELSPDNFEENYINRTAILLKPKQAFLDWYSNLNPDDEFQAGITETNIYLIDDSMKDLEEWLKKKFDRFFTMELYEWHTNKKEWPQNRNYKMFKEWFHVEISSMIYDLEKKPVLKSGY